MLIKNRWVFIYEIISFSDTNSNGNTDEREQKEVEETSKIGKVSRDVYFGYVKSGANIVSVIVLLLMAACLFGANTFSDIWISVWTNFNDIHLGMNTLHNCRPYFNPIPTRQGNFLSHGKA